MIGNEHELRVSSYELKEPEVATDIIVRLRLRIEDRSRFTRIWTLAGFFTARWAYSPRSQVAQV